MGRRPPERHTTYFNLRDALEAPGCAICTVVTKAVAKSLDDLLYERVNDPGVRQELRQSHGFCHRHAWELCGLGDGFGVGLLYRDLLKRTVTSLQPEGYTRSTPSANCPTCQMATETAGRYLDSFVQAFAEVDLRLSMEHAMGLCLSHFKAALTRCRTRAERERLTAWEQKKLSELLEQLNEFLRKHDYRYVEEGYREGEGSSWLRAVEIFVGKPDELQRS